MPTKILPKELTSYDVLKMLAIFLMACDHIGHYFYPDDMWWRVFGRMCLPIWFFLIGYARTAELSRDLWVGGILVLASAVVTGQFLFPVNILFTILILRYLRDAIAVRAFHSPESLRGMFLLLFFMTFPTAIAFEYGSAAMMLALIGYLVRHKEDIETRIDRRYLILYAFVSLLSFYLIQGMYMPSLSDAQALVMFFGFIFVGLILWRFRPVVYIDAERYMARSIIRVVQFLGRNTLEIYVIHLIVFRLVCMYLYPDTYEFMAWNFVPWGAGLSFL